MSWGRAGVCSVLFWASAAVAAPEPSVRDDAALRPPASRFVPWARGEALRLFAPADHWTVAGRVDLFDSKRPRAVSLGYSLGDARARVQVRAGYRYGLPLDPHGPAFHLGDDQALVLTSGGSVAISAGTVAWLQLDLDGFREIAGRRFMRLDAVPGLRFRLDGEAPVEAGVGVLASLRPRSGETFGIERFAAILQVSGRF